MFGKKKKESEEKKEVVKSESTVVTKESICSTCAVFFFLAFLILCTRTLIFGEVGKAVHIFLTGTFGYLAYPVILGALYLSVMGLFGKKLVKDRKTGACVAFALIFVALLAHTVATYSWTLDGYLKECFHSGESFPKTAPCGFFGGVVVLCVSSLFSAIGAAIVFGLLAALCVTICVLRLRKKGSVSVQSEEVAIEDLPEQASPVAPVQSQRQASLPVRGEADGYPLPEREIASAYGGQTTPVNGEEKNHGGRGSAQGGRAATPVLFPETRQRPGVSLSEERVDGNNAVGKGFSPFATPNAENQSNAPFGGKEWLFADTPADNYRRNLLFDPNAKVNQRKGNLPVQQPTVESQYTPSYTKAYENEVNDNAASYRPTKIVNEVVEKEESSYENNDSLSYVETPAYERPAPHAPVEEELIQSPAREEVVEETPEAPYRRHEYMDLFSTSNPNVFGNEEESARFGRDFADRVLRREERTSFEEETPRKDGINLLDEEDDPYTLRSDFDVDRTEGRGREIEETSREEEFTDRGRMEETRSFNEEIVEERRGREFDEEDLPRGRGFEEETRGRGFAETPVQPVQPVPPPKHVEPPKPRIIKPYVRPRLDDFDCRDIEPTANQEEIQQTKDTIIATLEEFKITGASIASVTFGPTVTRYNVTIPRNISPRKVIALTEPIGISLYSPGVSIYPNYEDGVVSIEVPNKERQFVQLGCMLTGDSFVNAKPSSLTFAMGKDVANRKVYGDVCKMVHMLVAGSTKAGKSVFLGSLIISLIYKYSPEELRLILIDPKQTEFVLYRNLPHLMFDEIITGANKAVRSLSWAIEEMERRYALFAKMSASGKYVVSLDDYNAQLEKNERLPKIVIIIDELADLMLAAKKEIEDRVQSITQKARAAGIHMIVATQRPSTDVITGVIKANLTTRIAFLVSTDVDSRVILDNTGAQKLLGAGDLLYTMPGINTPVRVQSAYISPEESQRVVAFIKNNNEAYYDEAAAAYLNCTGGNGGDSVGKSSEGELDPIYIEALRVVIQSKSASISMIQRKCSTGYNRAGKIVEWMEDMGYISDFDGAKSRKVLITQEEFESKYGPL